MIWLRRALLLTTVFAASLSGVSAQEDPISITILKVEVQGDHSYLLFSVDNGLNQHFDRVGVSCVWFDKGHPVHEDSSSIQNVVPLGKTIKREIQGYGGPSDKIECRVMDSYPPMH